MQVFRVAAGVSLAQETANLVKSKISSELSLADVTIWVPSPRIVQAMRDAFLADGASILPNIRAFSVDDDTLDMLHFDGIDVGVQDVVNPLSRLMFLTSCAQARSLSFSLAMESATQLARLFDRLIAYQVNIDDIGALVPESLASHWQKNLSFLNIVFGEYPNWLAEQNKTDMATLNRDGLLAQAEYYALHGLKGLTIAAGFSDTTPAGMAVIKAILQNNDGYLILPSLDVELTNADWQSLPPTHGQYALSQLLAFLNLDRQDLQLLGKEPSEQEKLWSHILNPNMLLPKNIPAEFVAKTHVVEADNVQLETDAIALIMRESLEHEGKTCALITSDRTLANRVSSALKRWHIHVNDSAGVPLKTTSVGQFMGSVLDVYSHKFSPLNLASLLQHPFVNPVGNKGEWRELFYAFDQLVLRGRQPQQGFLGLRQKVAEQGRDPFAPNHLAEGCLACIEKVENCFAPLLNLSGKNTLSQWMDAHLNVARLLCGLDENEAPNFMQGSAGQAMKNLFSKWKNVDAAATYSFYEYLEIIEHFMLEEPVRERYSLHPRLFVWGPLEARQQAVDRVILGSVNEGVWPRKVTPDPWLCQALTSAVGLPEPDMHVGLNAHDFMTLSCSDEVFITRSVRGPDGESVPSRFLSRLYALLPEEKKRPSIWLERAKQLQNMGQSTPVAPASVSPEQRPIKWSASTVKDLMQCPYKLYAKKVLKLEKYKLYEEPPSPSERGNLIHQVMETFFAEVEGLVRYSGDFSEQDIYTHLTQMGERVFAAINQKAIRELWGQRFDVIAKGVAKRMAEDYATNRKIQAVEVESKIQFQSIELTARADRLDVTHDNGQVIVDYKTGSPPKPSDIQTGQEPQMLIEALLVHKGAFGKVQPVAGLEYWHLQSSGQDGLAVNPCLGKKFDMVDLPQALEDVERVLHELVTMFVDDKKPFEAIPGGASALEKVKQCNYCDYASVCRFKEWVARA